MSIASKQVQTDTVGASSFATGLGAFGQTALDDFGARLVVLFSATAVIGCLLLSVRGRDWWVPATVAAIAGCAVLVVMALRRHASSRVLIAVSVVAAGAAAVSAADTGVVQAIEGHQVSNWLVAGLAGSLAVSRGPGWGLGMLGLSVTAALIVEAHLGGDPTPLSFLGPLSYFFGGAGTHMAARRGFRMTEQVVLASARALAAQQIAEERWRLARMEAGQLHDTVLSTLSILALSGSGLDPADIRDLCQRDLDSLTAGATAWDTPGDQASPIVGDGSAASVIQEAVAAAERIGITCRMHGLDTVAHSMLEPHVADALRATLGECVANVRRHSGVLVADITVSRTDDAVIVGVVDEGDGFDTSAVSQDRLGLRTSVRARIRDAGGSVSVWSRPASGTSVLVRVPAAGHPATPGRRP